MVFPKSREVLGVLAAAVAGMWAEAAGRESPEVWREVFAYCQEVSAGFGADGEAVVVRQEVEAPAPPEPSGPPFDPDGKAAEQASGGDAERKAAFLAWLEGEYADAGDAVMVAGTDEGGGCEGKAVMPFSICFLPTMPLHGAVKRQSDNAFFAMSRLDWAVRTFVCTLTQSMSEMDCDSCSTCMRFWASNA